MQAYTGTATSIFVTDSLMGGPFALVTASSGVAQNGGTIFNATGLGATKYWQRIYKGAVHSRWFGAKGDGSTDDATAIQAMVNYCNPLNLAIDMDGVNTITTSIVINRKVDSTGFDKPLLIMSSSGGGFKTTTAIPIFTTTIPFTTAPVSQMINFKDLAFESTDTTSTVLDNAKFLRINFDKCTFLSIKLLYAPTVYVQSIHLTNWCNIRRWTGIFFNSNFVNFDVKFDHCIAEAGDRFINATYPDGMAVTNTTMEGMSGYAIRYENSHAFNIENCFFEANTGYDIDGSASTTTYGVSLISNNFTHTNTAEYSVRWGTGIAACKSEGNYHNGSMHYFQAANADTWTRDIVLVSLQNYNTQPFIAGKFLTADIDEYQSDVTSLVTTRTKIDKGYADARYATISSLGALAFEDNPTSGQVITGLGYTPVNPSSLGALAYENNPTSGQIITGLGYTPVNNTTTVNGHALSSNVALVLSSTDFSNQGTTTQILHGNASGIPGWGQLLNADITDGTIDLTTKVTGLLPNANLANSTISGISLGGNLANLTATDATLTFSGSYNGNIARTVGLNLTNANTWSAIQSFSSGLSLTGSGAPNVLNSLGLDNYLGISRFYSHGSNTSTKGSFDFHNSSSDGSLDIVSLSIDENGNAAFTGNLSATLPAYSSGTYLPAIYNSTNNRFETLASYPSNKANGYIPSLTAAQTLTSYNVGASDAPFLVSANILVTASSVNNFTVTCSYYDESNTVRVVTLNFSQLAGTLVTAITNVTGTGVYEGIPIHIRAKAGTTIFISTTGTFTSITYNGGGLITQEAAN